MTGAVVSRNGVKIACDGRHAGIAGAASKPRVSARASRYGSTYTLAPIAGSYYAADGTPLSYRQTGGPNISLTINSLDDPESVQPEMQFSAAMEVSWCGSLASLPVKEMDATATPGFVNHQHGGD